MGDQFLDDYCATLQLIREQPMSFAIHEGKVRRAKCGRFPHYVFFQQVRRDLVKITSVYHPNRDPTKWRDER